MCPHNNMMKHLHIGLAFALLANHIVRDSWPSLISLCLVIIVLAAIYWLTQLKLHQDQDTQALIAKFEQKLSDLSLRLLGR
jgi:hypothetical protein